MNLFNPYTKKSIIRDFNIKPENDTTSRPISLHVFEYGKNNAHIKFSQRTSMNKEKHVSFIFQEDNLDFLIDKLSELKGDLENNKKYYSFSYPKNDLVNLYFDIIEHYYGYSNNKKNTPEPYIAIIKKDEKYFLTAVDFKNKNVLLYHEIFLKENGFVLDKDDSKISEILDQIMNSVSNEIIQAAEDKVDSSDLIYISNFKKEDYNKLKEVVRDYVRNTIRIETFD